MTTTSFASDAEHKREIKQALNELTNGDLLDASKKFFNVLGYVSERTLYLSGVPEDFAPPPPPPPKN